MASSVMGSAKKIPLRFLIVRLSAIGDTVHTLPLAAALKRHFPGCHIGWVVEKPSAPLVVDNPLVDWHYVLPKGWLKSFGTVSLLRRALKEQKFDTCFDVQGLTKSAVAALLSGAKTRVGFARGEGRELAPLLDTVRVEPAGVHAIDKTLSLLSAVGVAAEGGPEFVFPPCPPEDRDVIERFFSQFPSGGQTCLMGPWGSFASKRWPVERFVGLSALLKNGLGLTSVILGHGTEEREKVKKAINGAAPGTVMLAPDVSVAGVVELSRRARLFVGCDSFPMHVAAGVGCPTVGLFGITDPERLGPRGAMSRSVFARITLVSSTRERRRLGPENMLALGVAQVAEACFDLMANCGQSGETHLNY